jgi:hypothetical protein
MASPCLTRPTIHSHSSESVSGAPTGKVPAETVGRTPACPSQPASPSWRPPRATCGSWAPPTTSRSPRRAATTPWWWVCSHHLESPRMDERTRGHHLFPRLAEDTASEPGVSTRRPSYRTGPAPSVDVGYHLDRPTSLALKKDRWSAPSKSRSALPVACGACPLLQRGGLSTCAHRPAFAMVRLAGAAELSSA